MAKSANPADLTKLIEIAQAAGHSGSIVADTAHILGPTDWAPTLNKLAFDAGIVLAQLAPILPTLEETFFEMTGDSQ
jgi:ABC-2 type transport system ATP-binding protein